MRSAMDTLPSDQCQVIELAYFGGFTHTEIAEMLETPVGTVKGRMRLGLKKMRDQLAERGGDAMMQTTGPDHERWEDAAGAYLLGALPEDERDAYVAHLAACAGLPRRGRRARVRPPTRCRCPCCSCRRRPS